MGRRACGAGSRNTPAGTATAGARKHPQSYAQMRADVTEEPAQGGVWGRWYSARCNTRSKGRGGAGMGQGRGKGAVRAKGGSGRGWGKFMRRTCFAVRALCCAPGEGVRARRRSRAGVSGHGLARGTREKGKACVDRGKREKSCAIDRIERGPSSALGAALGLRRRQPRRLCEVACTGRVVAYPSRHSRATEVGHSAEAKRCQKRRGAAAAAGVEGPPVADNQRQRGKGGGECACASAGIGARRGHEGDTCNGDNAGVTRKQNARKQR